MSSTADPKKVKVIHILKDGTVLDDITGHVVSYEDCPGAYHILAKVLDRRARERQANKTSENNTKR